MKRIPKIEEHQFYIDIAFARAKKRAIELKQGMSGKLNLFHYKKIELARITTVADKLKNDLQDILHSFPSVDALPTFYNELIKATVEYDELKKSLGALNWAAKKIHEFEGTFSRRVKATREIITTAKHRKDFYGRLSSVMRQIRTNLVFLEEARLIFAEFPSVKENMFNVCIAGFPNVGKSTILSQITPAKPEIANYAFTTKGLNLGYMKVGHEKVQVMDTPGTLNRFDAMNTVEKQAYLALQHVAHAIVYVFDITETSTAPLDEQKELYERVLGYEKPVIIYLAKTDLLTKEEVSAFKKEYADVIISPMELKVKIELLSKIK